MRARKTTSFIALALSAGLASASPAAAAGANSCEHATAVPGTVGQKAVQQATLCLLNSERTERGLKPLKPQRQLERAAFRFSKQMVRQRFFDHVSPTGSTPTKRIKKVRYITSGRAWSIGENIAWGTGSQGTPERIVDAWMKSPGHRRNILDRSFREVGVGVVQGAPVPTASKVGATYTTNFGYRR